MTELVMVGNPFLKPFVHVHGRYDNVAGGLWAFYHHQSPFQAAALYTASPKATTMQRTRPVPRGVKRTWSGLGSAIKDQVNEWVRKGNRHGLRKVGESACRSVGGLVVAARIMVGKWQEKRHIIHVLTFLWTFRPGAGNGKQTTNEQISLTTNDRLLALESTFYTAVCP